MRAPGESCTCGRCSWDPSTNLMLCALRQAWPNRPDEDRQTADHRDVDEDGMVSWRPARLNEQLAYIVAKWIWEDTVVEDDDATAV